MLPEIRHPVPDFLRALVPSTRGACLAAALHGILYAGAKNTRGEKSPSAVLEKRDRVCPADLFDAA